MLSDGIPSIVAAASGLLAGYLYETDGYGLQNWRLPRPVEVSASFLLILVQTFVLRLRDLSEYA